MISNYAKYAVRNEAHQLDVIEYASFILLRGAL